MNKQEIFWKEKYASEYIARNSMFDLDSGIKAWAQMTKNLGPVRSILECGCNWQKYQHPKPPNARSRKIYN